MSINTSSKQNSTNPLEQQLSLLLDRRRQESRLRDLKASAPGSIDFSSNDFLSLSTDPTFRHDYLSTLQKSSFQLGSTGSRLLDGNSIFAEQLEKEIAAFHNAPSGLLNNSGFDANVSLFSCLPQPGDVIVYDELIHASVHDGMRQSRAAACIPFAHNSLQDLHRQLQHCITNYSNKNVFVAVESVYSMEGDLSPLTEIVDLLNTLFPGHNAHLIVDEAHATGIYGPHGRGRVSQLDLESHVFARLHTFGKSLASNGAIILCSPTTRLYLINYARPIIYTTFLAHPTLLAIQHAYTFLSTTKTTSQIQHLFYLIQYLYSSLETLDTNLLRSEKIPSSVLKIPTRCPDSPIFALYTSHPRALAARCQQQGYVVRPVVPPTVPVGTDRVRVCLHAGNTEREVDGLVGVVRKWVEEWTGYTNEKEMVDDGGGEVVQTKSKL